MVLHQGTKEEPRIGIETNQNTMPLIRTDIQITVKKLMPGTSSGITVMIDIANPRRGRIPGITQ